MMAPLSALCERSDYKLFHLNSSSHNGEIVQLQSALNDDSNNFQENSNTCHISEPIIGRFFPNLVLVRSLRGSFIASFSSAKKRCNTSQGFGAFFGQSCDRDRFLFPFISELLSFFSLFLDFIAISDCVFNNKNHYVLGHTGYQIIITILVISTLNANLRVATRVYDVEGGAIFSKNSTFVFFDGAAWTPRLRSPSPIMAPGLIDYQEGVMNSPLGWFEVSGHRDVTTWKAREFAESSKMALATMLKFGLQTYFLCY